MKVLNYIAILSVLSMGGMLNAADNVAPQQPQTVEKSANGFRVQTSVTDKEVAVKIDADNKDALLSSDDMMKKILKESVKALSSNSNHAKIVNALMTSIKASIKDVNEPVKGPVSFRVSLRPESENEINSTVSMNLNDRKFVSEAKSTVNPDQSVSTIGNVSVTEANGVTSTNPVAVKTDANGAITGTVGASAVADKTVEAQAGELLVETQSNSDSKTNESKNVRPDNTIVTSGQR